MYSLEEALVRWETAGNYGTAEARLSRAKQWIAYYSYLAKRSLGTPYQGDAQAACVADFMVREGILKETDTLLDIGAGMGGYSVELAKHCAQVTAIDMNEDCLAILRDRGRQWGLTNLQTKCVPWEQACFDEKFDVSFSAMCPAICNREELLKMERMTAGTACILTVTRGSYEKLRKELMGALPLKRPGGMVSEALHYYNALYLMGREPNVKTWSVSTHTSSSVEELIQRYGIYFKIFGIEESASVPYMRNFFAQRASNGIVEDESRINYALVYWHVPSETE